MIEEPYRWVEAIATRRDYIETQLSSGSPIIVLTYADGILLFTVGRQKLFEIYDRIALGAIGHPGDIERLRMAAIELASTEGFARSSADVSLRRLAYYSLSPVMKNAFEQIYGAPFLARLLFAEIGLTPAEDLILRVEYDGAISQKKSGETGFAVLAATKKSAEQMEQFLEREHRTGEKLVDALELAFDTWIVGQRTADETTTLPTREEIRSQRSERAGNGAIEAIVLERASRSAQRYRAVEERYLASLTKKS
jgi:proteasome alpha subunit